MTGASAREGQEITSKHMWRLTLRTLYDPLEREAATAAGAYGHTDTHTHTRTHADIRTNTRSDPSLSSKFERPTRSLAAATPMRRPNP